MEIITIQGNSPSSAGTPAMMCGRFMRWWSSNRDISAIYIQVIVWSKHWFNKLIASGRRLDLKQQTQFEWNENLNRNICHSSDLPASTVATIITNPKSSIVSFGNMLRKLTQLELFRQRLPLYCRPSFRNLTFRNDKPGLIEPDMWSKGQQFNLKVIAGPNANNLDLNMKHRIFIFSSFRNTFGIFLCWLSKKQMRYFHAFIELESYMILSWYVINSSLKKRTIINNNIEYFVSNWRYRFEKKI